VPKVVAISVIVFALAAWLAVVGAVMTGYLGPTPEIVGVAQGLGAFAT
jgi:hypothetical protein